MAFLIVVRRFIVATSIGFCRSRRPFSYFLAFHKHLDDHSKRLLALAHELDQAPAEFMLMLDDIDLEPIHTCTSFNHYVLQLVLQSELLRPHQVNGLVNMHNRHRDLMLLNQLCQRLF